MPWLHLHLGHICTYRCVCIKYVCVIYIWSIYFAYSLQLGFFVCLFKPLIKFWHSRFLFSGVQGQGLKDACRVQNAFLGKKKRRKTTLQKQTAPMTCPSVSHKEFLANTMHAFIVGLCQAYHSLQNFPSGPVHTHRHGHSQSVSRYCDYSYDRSWLGCMPCQKFDVAWRAVFRYAECVVAGLSDMKRWFCFVTGSGEQLGKRESQLFPPFPSLQIQKEVIPHTLPYKWLQMRTVWKSKIETKAFPSVF